MKNKQAPKELVSYKLPQVVVAALRQRAVLERRTQTAVLLAALEAYLEGNASHAA